MGLVTQLVIRFQCERLDISTDSETWVMAEKAITIPAEWIIPLATIPCGMQQIFESKLVVAMLSGKVHRSSKQQG